MTRRLASLNLSKIEEVASAISRLDLKRSDVFDERFFPSKDEDVELSCRYFIAMVAIDHRTHFDNRPFEAVIDGVVYRGSDLLWRLGKIRLDEDSNFFSPDRLSGLDIEEVGKWLRGNYGPVWDYGVRAYLLKDIGKFLKRAFGGNALRLLEVESLGEFVERLSGAIAYSDPVRKKAFLLAKFLIARGLLEVDVSEFKLPIDNHLTRIAYRLGIVKLEEWIVNTIREGIHVNHDIDVNLRLIVRDAWDMVIRLSKVDPIALDDFLWNHGRRVCTSGVPQCGLCPLKDVCLAYERRSFIDEHVFYLTYYY